jgi:hypothetical protein
MADIHLPGDIRVQCPDHDCSVRITLTREGVEMVLARQTKCREHGLLLEVADDRRSG